MVTDFVLKDKFCKLGDQVFRTVKDIVLIAPWDLKKPEIYID